MKNEIGHGQMPQDRLTIVKALAEKLRGESFDVLANHPAWEHGNPISIFGVVPDVVASKGHQRYTFMIEDEGSFLNINQLRQRLASILQFPRENVYLVVPVEIVWQGRCINPVRHMRERTQNWGYNVKIATYDRTSQCFNFNPWKDLGANP